MAFVPGFEFDVFISYSHVDNLPVEDERWVERFHDRLQVELYRREGTRDIRIWRDDTLDGNQKFERTLQSKLEKSATLLCLNSPGYTKSEYCTKERDWFEGAHRNRLQVGDRSRIFNVRLFDIPNTSWPNAFRGDSGFEFFDMDRPGTEGFPLEVRGGVFAERLRRLTNALLTTLREMRERAVKPEGSEAVPGNDLRRTERRACLFFAKVSDSLATRKKRVVTELTGEGFEVLELAHPAHEEVVAQRIKQADLSVHLLDQFPGEEISGEGKGYIQRQAEIGLVSSTPKLIWVPKDLALGDQPEPDDPEEKAYRSFLRELESGSRNNAVYDFVRGAPAEITREILDRLKRPKAPPQAGASQTAILLDFHPKDEPYFYEVYKYLDEKGIQPKLNRAVDDPRGSTSRFEDQLERVNAMIVFFGQVARDWVLERVLAAARSAALRRHPVKFGIYLAPPRKLEGGLPDDWAPLAVYPIDNTGGFDPNSFVELLDGLSKARAKANRV